MILTFDTETDSLDPLSATLVGIAYKVDDQQTIYTHDKDLVKGLIEQADLLIGHNLKFDLAIMGYPKYNKLFDTMIAEWVIHPEKEQPKSLKKLSLRYFGVKQVTYNELMNRYKPRGMRIKDCTLDCVPPEVIESYCTADVDNTYRLYVLLNEELDKAGMKDLFTKLEMRFVPTLLDMERNGITLNPEPIKQMAVVLNKTIANLRELLAAYSNGINIDSHKELSDLLFYKFQLPYTKRMKKGLFSIDAEELGKLKDSHPIIPLYLEYSQLKKINTTYTDSLLKFIRKDGKIHGSFNHAGTATGRISSDSPNCQNIPEKGEYGGAIRKAFVADLGYKLCSFDYNQMELRLLAGMSKDQKMMAVFRDGGDVHIDTAKALFKRDDIDAGSNERKMAKTVNFGIIYGQTAFGLAKKMSIPEKEARDFIYRWACKWSDAWYFRKEKIREVEERLKTQTILGRIRDLSNLKGNVMTRAVNTPIQGSAGDLVKVAMIRLYKALQGSPCRLLLQIHDELVYEIPEEQIDYWVPIIKGVMESVNILTSLSLNCPMVVDVSVGDSWYFKNEEESKDNKAG